MQAYDFPSVDLYPLEDAAQALRMNRPDVLAQVERGARVMVRGVLDGFILVSLDEEERAAMKGFGICALEDAAAYLGKSEYAVMEMTKRGELFLFLEQHTGAKFVGSVEVRRAKRQQEDEEKREAARKAGRAKPPYPRYIAAQMIGVSEATICRYCSRGVLRLEDDGINAEDVENFAHQKNNSAEYMTTAEAARVLGCCPTTVRDYMAKGYIKRTKSAGGRVSCKRADVLALSEKLNTGADEA